jgi:hypothetical protein
MVSLFADSSRTLVSHRHYDVHSNILMVDQRSEPMLDVSGRELRPSHIGDYVWPTKEGPSIASRLVPQKVWKHCEARHVLASAGRGTPGFGCLRHRRRGHHALRPGAWDLIDVPRIREDAGDCLMAHSKSYGGGVCCHRARRCRRGKAAQDPSLDRSRPWEWKALVAFLRDVHDHHHCSFVR